MTAQITQQYCEVLTLLIPSDLGYESPNPPDVTFELQLSGTAVVLSMSGDLYARRLLYINKMDLCIVPV